MSAILHIFLAKFFVFDYIEWRKTGVPYEHYILWDYSDLISDTKLFFYVGCIEIKYFELVLQ